MKISSEPSVGGELWEMLPVGPRRALAQAAASEFGKRGYHATTTRHIAEHVGMSPAGLYVHYASKAELLFTISRIGHESVLSESSAALEGISSPDERVHALVRSFTIWHAVNHNLARVIQYELRSLEPKHYQVIAAIRRSTEALAAEVFRPLFRDAESLSMHTVAILSLGIDVARWYVPGRSPDPIVLGEAYAKLARNLLRA
ncbi:TetR/AcrR family transcriptional regulator [Oryzicola mucosus]|uniref:TetR/AcrR family transcriptional regulator n=1 Tax=Oryzicola mucosus TaxID=2767425 RepID=A0A8J6PYV2_9HYPH|nr:TetR/AcrR family transcriptional regulator [Oryzicola mucosus]MBD0416882.1 TetR/AcrR family transcriptional regulator [Oryzicola mucosus]